MFAVGLVIFILYMWGLIAMINRSHASQSKTSHVEKEVNKGIDDTDWRAQRETSLFDWSFLNPNIWQSLKSILKKKGASIGAPFFFEKLDLRVQVFIDWDCTTKFLAIESSSTYPKYFIQSNVVVVSFGGETDSAFLKRVDSCRLVSLSIASTLHVFAPNNR